MVGLQATYQVLRFPKVRQRSVVCIHAFPYDWQVFAYHRPEDWQVAASRAPVRLGSTKEKPKEAEVGRLIDQHPELN